MNTPLLQRLRKHLNSITPAQFQKEWKEIEDMGFTADVPAVEFAQTLLWTEELWKCREKIQSAMSRWIQRQPSTSLSFETANKIYNQLFNNELKDLIGKLNISETDKLFLFTELKKYYGL